METPSNIPRSALVNYCIFEAEIIIRQYYVSQLTFMIAKSCKSFSSCYKDCADLNTNTIIIINTQYYYRCWVTVWLWICNTWCSGMHISCVTNSIWQCSCSTKQKGKDGGYLPQCYSLLLNILAIYSYYIVYATLTIIIHVSV